MHVRRPGLVRETFHRTPVMSTYLLAFIVSEFAVRENVQKTFNVYSRANAFAQTEYSFNIGQQMLAKFDEIFDYKYYSVPEITKMSMAALPDFDAGGEFVLVLIKIKLCGYLTKLRLFLSYLTQ